MLNLLRHTVQMNGGHLRGAIGYIRIRAMLCGASSQTLHNELNRIRLLPSTLPLHRPAHCPLQPHVTELQDVYLLVKYALHLLPPRWVDTY
jgi:hypothetical protein